ncbi:hypothetical protein ACFL96_16360 [Thermoproteota archaeon]
MKRLIITILSLVFSISLINSAITAAGKNYGGYYGSYAYLVDNFEDEDITNNPKWWAFGDLYLSFNDNAMYNIPYLGKKSIMLEGQTSNRYIGGLGTFLAIDGTRYDTLKLYVYGSGKDSGALRIELYDDDNHNHVIERNPRAQSSALYDDVFTYTFSVDWQGWRVIIIPLWYFSDTNVTAGDNIWNPNQLNGSGGLIQMQIIVLASDLRGEASIQLDAVKFYNAKRIR